MSNEKAQDQPNVHMDSAEISIVTHDFQREPREIPLPEGSILVGELVCDGGGPNFSDASVLLEASFDAVPGQFLAVMHVRRGANIATVCQVADVRETNPSESPELAAARKSLGLGRGYAGEGQSTRIFRIAEVTVVEEFELQPGSWTILETRTASRLARSGDPVVLLPDELLARALGTLERPSDGIEAGWTHGPTHIDVVFKPVLFQLGAFVAGNPGRGKSYFCGDLLEEAHAWGIPTLALDINGELLQTARALGGVVITLPNKEQFGLTLNLLTSPELISVTPGVHPGTQYAELIELAHERLKADHGTTRITFNDLLRKIEELGPQLEIKPSGVKTALARLRKLEQDPLLGGQDFDFIAQLVAKKLVVLDCRYLSMRQTQLIAAAAARTLQEKGKQMTQAANGGDAEAAKWFSLLYVDEAHTVAPANDSVVSTQVLYELARMGRHVRTGLIFSSQSPADLDSSILKRLQTRFIFALESDQLRAIPGIHADLHERIIAQLPKLPQGVCAVSGSSEVVNHGFLMHARRRRTPVGGSTPKVFDSRKKTQFSGDNHA